MTGWTKANAGKCCRTSTTQAHVLNDLVEDILTLSQIDGGRVPARHRPD